MKRKILFRLTLSFMLINACKDEDGMKPVDVPEAGDLVRYEYLNTYEEQDIKSILNFTGFGQFSDFFEEPIDLYRVSYHTTFKGELITCSGLISFPNDTDDDDALPKLVFNHGTLFAHSDAPSKQSLSVEALMASAGYVTLIPDYIGFGDSEDFLHPYYVREPIAAAVVDMIHASDSFVSEMTLRVNNQLFLTGYSEGGYVTLATQRAIEMDPGSGLVVTASAAGAGGYNLRGVMDKILANEQFSAPSYLVYILMAYRSTLDWNAPLTDFFQEPFTSNIPGLFNGSFSGLFINQQLTDTLSWLFQPSFLSGLKSGNETLLLPALESNSLTDWTPQAPTRLYHGTSDGIVPFEDSEETFQFFQQQGASALQFFIVPNGTHNSSFPPMLINVAEWFESLKED